jgi:hypothetical protein
MSTINIQVDSTFQVYGKWFPYGYEIRNIMGIIQGIGFGVPIGYNHNDEKHIPATYDSVDTGATRSNGFSGRNQAIFFR